MGDTVFKVIVLMGCEPVQAVFEITKFLSGDFFSDRSQQKSCSSDGDVKANEQQTLTNIQVQYVPPKSPSILFRTICKNETSPVFKSILIMITSNNTQQCAPRQQCCKPMACGCGEPLRNSCKMPINRKTYEVH